MKIDLLNSSNIAANECAAQLMEAVHPVVQFIRTEMRSQREPALSVPQFRVLAFLSLHAGASLSEVAEHLGVTRATASTNVDRLVQRGLVDRTDHPHQRRQVVLKLTPTGSSCLEAMKAITQQRIAVLLKQLPSQELAQVKAGLQILQEVFQQAVP
jgi:DNA-binding MarR family transcriptional regulator